jgi:hypothetical protein
MVGLYERDKGQLHTGDLSERGTNSDGTEDIPPAEYCHPGLGVSSLLLLLGLKRANVPASCSDFPNIFPRIAPKVVMMFNPPHKKIGTGKWVGPNA